MEALTLSICKVSVSVSQELYIVQVKSVKPIATLSNDDDGSVESDRVTEPLIIDQYQFPETGELAANK